MCLITVERGGKVRMHNLIQEVGWEIVHQESPEVGKHRRLWLTEDVNQVLLVNMGTNAIEGVKLDLPVFDNLRKDSSCSKLSQFSRKELLRPVDSDSSSLKLPFQKLKWLDLENCILSEADFLMPPNGFDNLKILRLCGNKFVSFPCFKRVF
ncbi:hypothetical protein FEM48_Zijuj05G0164700 [Ziziphus jujuba var. spinosa]|uniref:Disease resistance protein Roq1-like winged-helix domain-containing protein n=1 Tax=Ziziphus jujuba var. spinosa TaxID=714518 RepID=A0A978VFW2_ZIZJJ|nr:hypothetical protein FEM48_Zijuj05G0164700 [Ziziphus jujuba var. spinosa]